MDTGCLQTQHRAGKGGRRRLTSVQCGKKKSLLALTLKGKTDELVLILYVMEDQHIGTSNSRVSLGRILAQGCSQRMMLLKVSHWTYLLLIMVVCGKACGRCWTSLLEYMTLCHLDFLHGSQFAHNLAISVNRTGTSSSTITQYIR